MNYLKTFEQLNNELDDLYISLQEIFPFSYKDDNIMLFSNKLKDDKPNVWGIEDGIYSLKLKIVDNTIVIVAIANQSGPLGLGFKVITKLHDFAIDNGYKIVINNDESMGFWDRVIKKFDDGIISINPLFSA